MSRSHPISSRGSRDPHNRKQQAILPIQRLTFKRDFLSGGDGVGVPGKQPRLQLDFSLDRRIHRGKDAGGEQRAELGVVGSHHALPKILRIRQLVL